MTKAQDDQRKLAEKQALAQLRPQLSMDLLKVIVGNTPHDKLTISAPAAYAATAVQLADALLAELALEKPE